MNRISFEGFNNKYATFNASNGVSAGKPVSLNSDGKCVKVADGDPLFGICTSVRNGIATVQLQGYAELETNDSFNYGYSRLVCGSTGQAVPATDDTDVPFVKIVKYDEDNQIVGFIF